MKVLLFLPLLICGCATNPTYKNASPEQRLNLFFIEDELYFESPQYTNDINDSVDTILTSKHP